MNCKNFVLFDCHCLRDFPCRFELMMKTWRHRPEERPTFRHCLEVVEKLQAHWEVANILRPAFNSASMNGNSIIFFLRRMNRLHLPTFIAIMNQFLFGEKRRKIKTLHQCVSFSRRNFQSILSTRRRKSQSQQRFVSFRIPLSHASSLQFAYVAVRFLSAI